MTAVALEPDIPRSPRYTPRVAITLTEWESCTPSVNGQGAQLRGLTLSGDADAQAKAQELATAGIVTITDMRDGLHIGANSYVGRIAIGPLDITINPKVAWGRWRTMFGFALRLRDVTRSQELTARVQISSLQDIVVADLLGEARDLVTRGLHREYEQQRRSLAIPRGRIDFSRIARQGGLTDARIPSRFTRRSDDTELNRTLRAALSTAASVAVDPQLRSDVRRLAQELGTTVTAVPLTAESMNRARRAVDRRTVRYEPSLRLAELLRTCTSIVIRGDEEKVVSIAGFAFDMNTLWQRLLARVLAEWLPDIRIVEEYTLRDLFRADPRFGSGRRPLPKPRPDFAVFRAVSEVVYLDAKYRDLWEKSLPRDMLYQVALYAAAQREGAAAMLYPTEAPGASEERFEICAPGDGEVSARVALRPVRLDHLEALIRMPPSVARDQQRAKFANELVPCA